MDEKPPIPLDYARPLPRDRSPRPPLPGQSLAGVWAFIISFPVSLSLVLFGVSWLFDPAAGSSGALPTCCAVPPGAMILLLGFAATRHEDLDATLGRWALWMLAGACATAVGCWIAARALR